MHMYIFLICIAPAFKMILKVTVPFLPSRHLACPLKLNNPTTEPAPEPLLGISGEMIFFNAVIRCLGDTVDIVDMLFVGCHCVRYVEAL
jgi:hypothetical protein